ncbi:NAD(P)H quinone oxidoreductase [Arenicella chitinivorans]|uniref:NAD(P)H quinone oxidoreductase n=1 Tax=Arenicella chitinivorans TaxID=1329800 RepID=A0A918VHB8_9GAMM|nr:NAD(P)H:quinone oxidoreductase [Arenicella chitinivorans]GGZ98912.1 NAD(P)H quinone oxidoreductase [Arenicella chitinivorans]
MNILIVYDTRLGSTQKMARLIARGVESVNHCQAVLRMVPPVGTDDQPAPVRESGDLCVAPQDLLECDALIIGSPTRFGNMTAALKHFLDGTSSLWVNGTLAGKPAGVFTSSSSMHGGQEATLLSMIIPLMHHGMLITGIPFTESALSNTESGGTPYGASHVAGPSNSRPISDEEKTLSLALGKRIATLAVKLANSA